MTPTVPGIMPDMISLESLEAKCIIGIYAWERKIKQKISIDLELPARVQKTAKSDRIEDALNYKQVAKRVLSFVEGSRFHLIETMAEKLAELLLQEFRLPRIKIRISKPGAIRGARNVSVEISRKISRKPSSKK